MARTTAGAVERILGDNWDGESDLDQFIDSATVLVTRVQACAVAKGLTLTNAELELIERWLSAHMYAQMDLLYQNKTTAGASASFQGQTGMYLESTRYGQTAVSLDYSGCLVAIASGKRQVASGFWMGKPPSEQTDYDARD